MLLFIDDRAPVTLVATATDTVDRSGSYTFAGLNFGDDYSNRTLVAVVGLAHSSSTGSLNQTSVTIGGAAASGDDTGDGAVTATTGVAGCGIWSAQPSGTSGSVVVNFTSATAQACSIYLFAVAGLASATATDTLRLNSGVGDTGTASGSGTIDISAGGVLITGTVRANNANDITLTGSTEQFDVVFDTVHRMAVGFDFRMSAQSGRTVGMSSTGNSAWAMWSAAFA